MKLLNNYEQISRRTRVLYVGSVPRLRPLSKSTLSLEGVGLYTSPTRARFEDPCQDIFRSSLEPVEKVLRDAKIDKSNGDTSEKTRNLVVVDVAPLSLDYWWCRDRPHQAQHHCANEDIRNLLLIRQ